MLYQRLIDADLKFKHRSNLIFFWFGVLIYTLGFTSSRIPNPVFIISDLLRLIGLFMFVPTAFVIAKSNFSNTYFKVCFIIYCSWAVFVIFRGVSLNYLFIKNTVFTPFGGIFAYLVPFFIFLPKPPLFYKLLFQVIYILGIFFLLQIFISWNSLFDLENLDARDNFEILVKTLCLPSGFILLTYNYHSFFKKLIAIIAVVIAFLLTVQMARRGLMFMTGSILFFAVIMLLLANKKRVVSFLFIILFGAIFVFYGLNYFSNSEFAILENVKERISEDTRSSVEEYYYADMEYDDWIIGRGMSGQVAAPIGIEGDDDISGMRDGIETDYLNIILKGGLIRLILLFLIAIPSMFNLFFSSSNILSKACGFWILLWLASLYPSTVTTFTLNYIIVWIAIGIGFSSQIRNMNDAELLSYFNNVKIF